MGRIYVVGIGPGSMEYVVPAALTAVKDAEVLVGGKRALELFKDQDKTTYAIATIPDTLKFIKENRTKNIAVLVSGDPGLFSLLPLLKKEFRNHELEVIPGISSIQLAFSQIKESYEDAVMVSLHGRDDENLVKTVSGAKKVAILTDAINTPQRIAKKLLDQGVPDREAWVLENLSYPDEKIIVSSLSELASDTEEHPLAIMIIGDVL